MDLRCANWPLFIDGASAKLDPKTDLRWNFDRFSPENLTANQPVVELLERFAEMKRVTPAQIVPIPGTRNPDHLNENLGAINVQLTPSDLRELESAFSKITVHGGPNEQGPDADCGSDINEHL